MKALRTGKISASSYGGLIEKIEIMRSSLRWASSLARPEIQKLLRQCTELRDEVMQVSRKERFVQATTDGADSRDVEPLTRPSRKKKSTRARRQALIDRSFVFEGVFGDSPRLLDAMEMAERAAPSDLPVLIEGKSGTGKELMAKIVHANSRRADAAFISVNCGAIPENLLESELFGHKKGAFTGASSDRKGKFEAANAGTIFLDEIGELPLQGQVKLLRVLQSQEIQRVGSDHAIAVDTRIVAATNRNLLEMAGEGTFREDLFYRLSVIQVNLPALQERRDEIPLLIDFFSDEAAEKLQRQPIQLTSRLRTFLTNYDYPGNIRELRNLIYRLSCLADEVADLPHLPESIRPELSGKDGGASGDRGKKVSLADAKKSASDAAEKLFLEQGLHQVGGKVSELARRAGMNRSYLQTLLKKHDISSKEFRAKK